MTRIVAVLATLDTKGEEVDYLSACLIEAGVTPLVVDLGIRGEAQVVAGVPRGRLARYGGITLEQLLVMDKLEAMPLVADAAAALLLAALAAGELHAAIGIGGGTGTWLASRVMRAMPLGFPKVMVSTLSARNSGRYLGTTDMTWFPSITDVAGVNPILARVLRNAAGAAAGMANAPVGPRRPERPLAGMTMYGVTTAGGTAVRQQLDQAGLDTIVFHANGAGGQTLERLIDEGAFAVVVDWTTSELADELVGGRAAAGPDRLEAAARRGVPQVVVPGALDIVNWGPPADIPAAFASRLMHLHRADSALMRTSPAENAALGAIVGRKLSAATAPVVVLIPARGFSSVSTAGQPFHDPAADAAFTSALRAAATDVVEIVEVDAAINDPQFAAAVASTAVRLWHESRVD